MLESVHSWQTHMVGLTVAVTIGVLTPTPAAEQKGAAYVGRLLMKIARELAEHATTALSSNSPALTMPAMTAMATAKEALGTIFG